MRGGGGNPIFSLNYRINWTNDKKLTYNRHVLDKFFRFLVNVLESIPLIYSCFLFLQFYSPHTVLPIAENSWEYTVLKWGINFVEHNNLSLACWFILHVFSFLSSNNQIFIFGIQCTICMGVGLKEGLIWLDNSSTSCTTYKITWDYSLGWNVRVHHECEVRIEKSVLRIAVWHHRLAEWWQTVIPRDGIFYPTLAQIMDSFSCSPLFLFICLFILK